MTTFGVIMFGEGRKAKIRCRSNGVTKPRVTMIGDTVSKMRCASAIPAELAREELPEDISGQVEMIRFLAGYAIEEVTHNGI